MSDSAAAKAIANQTGIRSYYEYQQTRVAKSELGKDDFLALLAAQLQYQDPLEPTKDTDFIAQLAQFSSLQYMQTMSETMTLNQNYSLVGKYVYAEVTLDTGEDVVVHGVVDRIITKDGKIFAQVGEYIIETSKISQIINNDIATDNRQLLENTNLIGKYVKAYVPDGEDEKGNPVFKSVEGLITRIAVEDNFLVGFLDNGTRVGLGDIYDISDNPFTLEDPPKSGENENVNNDGDGDGDGSGDGDGDGSGDGEGDGDGET